MNVANVNRPLEAIPPPSGKPKSRMSLDNVTRGPILLPPRVLLYGVEGVGKSQFAAGAPKPIWLGEPKGSAHLDVQRMATPESWRDWLDAVQFLVDEPHEYQTLVLDGLKDVERHIHAHLCAEHNWRSIEELDYGKGYTAAVVEWSKLTAALERLHDRRKMGIVLIGHSEVKTHRSPDVEAFDRHRLDLNEKAASILRRLVDYVLFAQIPVSTVRGSDKRARGKMDSDVRVIHTQPGAAFEAKSRPGIPGPLPLEWAEFHSARMHALDRHRRCDETLKRIDALLGELADEAATTKVKAYLATLAPGDLERLEEVANKVEIKVQAKNKESEK